MCVFLGSEKWVSVNSNCFSLEPSTMAVEESDSKEIPQSKIEVLEGHTKPVIPFCSLSPRFIPANGVQKAMFLQLGPFFLLFFTSQISRFDSSFLVRSELFFPRFFVFCISRTRLRPYRPLQRSQLHLFHRLVRRFSPSISPRTAGNRFSPPPTTAKSASGTVKAT